MDSGIELTAILAGRRDGLVVNPALNEFAPFHVVEEECFIAVLVVDLRNEYRTADVETESVEPQFGRLGTRCIKEVGIRVECIIAEELPGPSVKILRPRLEDHGHGRAGRKPELRAVVRSELAELRDGIYGRQDANVSRSPAVIVFAA